MSKSVQVEPFLDDEMIVFQNLFTLMDPAYNTSEIKPIMLSIPKSIKNKLRAQAQAAPKPQEQPSSTLGSVLHKSRLLTSSTIAPTKVEKKEDAKTKSSGPKKEEVLHQSPRPEKPQVDSTHITLDPIIEKFVTTEDLFWMLPVPIKRTASFHMHVQQNNDSFHFKLYFDKSKDFVIKATVDGTSPKSMLSVTIPRSQKYNITSLFDETNNTSFATLSENGKVPTEICAIKFIKEGVYDLFIPALKKNKQTGISCMIPITFNGQKSTLLEKYQESSYESIKIQSRSSTMGENIDYTFGGRFLYPDKTNVILFHKSNVNKDIITYGQTDDSGFYMLNVSYPMSVIQGFFVAISAHLTL